MKGPVSRVLKEASLCRRLEALDSYKLVSSVYLSLLLCWLPLSGEISCLQITKPILDLQNKVYFVMLSLITIKYP